MCMTETIIPLTSRPFRDEGDFWRIRKLAIETYPITGPGWNWDMRRWDGSLFYHQNPVLDPKWERTIRLWETTDGLLAGAANGESDGWFNLQLHPDFRDYEEEMISWAEANLASRNDEESGGWIASEVYEYDAPRLRILEKRGYQKLPSTWVFRRMRFGNRALPPVTIADGYHLRAIRAEDMQDCQRLADLLNASFGRTFHNAMEFHQFARLAPSYREDLHLVAEAPDGVFGAHVGVIYDETNRRGLYEPVCTHPDHRRKKLARSLMFAGLHRLKDLGACEVTVETGGEPAANALYDSIGFSEVYRAYVWRKML
jgi:mycothiol synthase